MDTIQHKKLATPIHEKLLVPLHIVLSYEGKFSPTHNTYWVNSLKNGVIVIKLPPTSVNRIYISL